MKISSHIMVNGQKKKKFGLFGYIVTEHLGGGTLFQINQDRVKNKRNQVFDIGNFTFVSNILYETLNGLMYLHSKKIINRDIKPDNIGIGFDNKVKIFDFGNASKVAVKSNSNIRPNLRKQRSVLQTELTTRVKSMDGTIQYMAPEISKDKSYDETVDIYSFGIMALEMLSRLNQKILLFSPDSSFKKGGGL
jgi:serine/threonine protein kinase